MKESRSNSSITKLSRMQLLKHFEQERSEWLAEGMSEADIHQIHFGDENENGRGGDYRMWLNERRHTRPDHKYAPGTPTAIDAVDPNNEWISSGKNGLNDAEFNIDLNAALLKLPTAQRDIVIAIYFHDKTPAEYAREKGINKSVVSRTLERAKNNLKNFLYKATF